MKTKLLLKDAYNYQVQKKQTTIFNSKFNLKFIFPVLLFAIFLLSTTEVQASHFRGGNLTWSQAGGNDINFTSNTQWRRSFFGSPTVGQTINLGTMNFGDGQIIILNAIVTGVDVANDILFMSWVYTKTYANPGNYEVSAYNDCCRTSDLQDGNADVDYFLKATVNVGGTFNNPPIASLPQLVNLPIGIPNATFSIQAVDPDGDNVTYRLATTAESGLFTTQPAGLSLSPTGVVTMDTSTRSVGQLFSVQFMIEDGLSKVPVDIKIAMVGTSSPPVFVTPTPADNTVYSVTPPGNTVSFTLAATDPDSNQSTTLNSIALPIGATMTPSLPETSAIGGTATSTFSWTPTIAQVGESILINFVAQDDTGVQTFRTITINVLCDLNVTIANSNDPSSTGIDDGSISVNIQNASAPENLIYSWTASNGFTSSQKDITGLAPGDYELRVNDTDTGCIGIVSQTLAVPAPNQAPTITCPVDIIVDNDPGQCGAVVNFTTTATGVGSTNTGAPIEYITNGGFETGDFSGWIVTDIDDGNFVVNDGTFNNACRGALPPINGSFDIASFQSNPGLHLISQPFIVPAGVTAATASWLDRIHNCASIFSDPNQEFRVEILDAAMVPIAEVFSTNPGDPLIQEGPNARSFDLTALMQTLEGQQICFRFSEQDNLLFFSVTLDDISFKMEAGSSLVCTSASGSVFPIGTTEVECTATNSTGSATCKFNVTVNDAEAPMIICPPDITVNKDTGICGATNISLGVPMITDNCSLTGNALDFDGSANGLNIPDFTQELVDAGQATISGWIYPRAANTNFPNLPFLNDIFKINEWQHLALTFDGTTLNVYHNGILLGSVLANVPISNTPNVFIDLGQLAMEYFPFTLDGKLDEVRVWNIARTQGEIQTDMNNEISAQPGLIALYHFNQGIAAGNNPGETIIIDDSGNTYDITLTNFALTGPTSNWVDGKTFSGVTYTNDAPVVNTPIVFDLGDVTVTYNANTAVYPLGDTIVTWEATDAAGNIASCIQTVTVESNVSPNVWTGNINSDWFNNGNWQSGLAPDIVVYGDIKIPTALTNYPVLTSGQNLDIDTCSTIIIESGASLTINPNVVVTNNGTVIIDGTMTFESDATGSAYIGWSKGMFLGDVTIERYIPANRAFRFLSTPATTTDFIANNWQQNTHITGSTVGANGFDATLTGNPSMFTFDNVAQTWNSIPNTDATNLTAGTPYRLIVRGDRTVDLSTNTPPPTPTTLVSKGELSVENAGLSIVALNENADGFSFIGNPFQAQVDMWATLNFSVNVNTNFYWVWDPNMNVRGAYVVVYLPNGGLSNTSSAANNNLQAGQACFVSTLNAGPADLNFAQFAKVTDQAETNVFKTGGKKSNVIAGADAGQLRLSLYETSDLASNQSEADGIWILFDDNGNNDIDVNDAIKFTNLDENFATSRDDVLLSIENRATPIATDKIQLQINTYRNSNYTLVANGNGLTGETPFLFDAYTNISTEIPQNGSIEYSYHVDENIFASIAKDRFSIVYQASTLSVAEQEIMKIQMYPNPTNTGSFYLNIPQNVENLEVTIYNSLGAKLYHKKQFESGRKVTIDTNFTSSKGVYFVELKSVDARTTKKLIIN